MKKIVGSVIFVSLLALSVSPCLSFDPATGDPAKGKELFASRCRNCHDGNQVKKMFPSKKTIRQWGKYFGNDQKRLKRKMVDFETYGFSQEELEHIHAFLAAGALDSGNAQGCPN